MWLCVFVSPSTHVLTEDVVYREVTADHQLLSRRLLMKTNRLPRWAERLFPAGMSRSVYIIEDSIVDPVNKSLTTYTWNLNHTTLMVRLCVVVVFFPAVYLLSCFREILINTQPVSCVMPFSWWVLIIIAFVSLCGGEKLKFSLDSACFSAEVAVKVGMCCLCFVFLHVKLCRTSVKAVILLPWYKESNVVWHHITVVVTGVVEYCGLPESGTDNNRNKEISSHKDRGPYFAHAFIHTTKCYIFMIFS